MTRLNSLPACRIIAAKALGVVTPVQLDVSPYASLRLMARARAVRQNRRALRLPPASRLSAVPYVRLATDVPVCTDDRCGSAQNTTSDAQRSLGGAA
jgi:hypothetical protein